MKLSLRLSKLELALATWIMKRPRRHRELELGARGVSVSTKVIPRDGAEHKIEIRLTNGLLVVCLDDVCIRREQLP